MRYTRYDYKKSGKFKFIVTVLIVILVSMIVGLYASNIIFKGNEVAVNSNNSSAANNEQIQSQHVIAVQCGYYSKKENADSLVTDISTYCQPFIIEEEGNYRVIAGIYNEELGLKKIEEFKSKGIDVARISIDIQGNTIDDKKIAEVVDGFLRITGKFEENDVKSIKTSEFKTWADKVINDENPIQSEKVKEIDNYIKNLPDEMDKNNNGVSEQTLYNIIK